MVFPGDMAFIHNFNQERGRHRSSWGGPRWDRDSSETVALEEDKIPIRGYFQPTIAAAPWQRPLRVLDVCHLGG
jgi:hypothetical protein